MKVTNANVDQRPQFIQFDYWREEEQIAFFCLRNHFGNDYQSIAEELNRTFFDRNYRPALLEFQQQKNNSYNHFTYDELNKIFRAYIPLLLSRKTQIWKKVSNFVEKSCQSTVFERRFHNFNRYLLIKLIHHYSNKYTKSLYGFRVKRFTMNTFNQIYFFGTLKLQNHEKENSSFADICAGCAHFCRIVKMWVDLKIVYEDYPVLPGQIWNIPEVSQQEFSQLMEQILLLDILFRLIFGLFPYSNDKDMIQYKPVIELEYSPVSGRFINSKKIEAYRERYFLEKTGRREDLTTEIYPQLDCDQIATILDSNLVVMLLPHMTFVHRNSTKIPI